MVSGIQSSIVRYRKFYGLFLLSKDYHGGRVLSAFKTVSRGGAEHAEKIQLVREWLD